MPNSFNTDTFKYENIFPIRIVQTSGNVANSQSILKNKPLQITTNEEDCIIFSNGTYGKNAEIILDFGKEIHGKLRILTHTAAGKSPSRFQITYGESVSEAISSIGNKGATNDHAIRDFSFYFPEFSDISLTESGFRFARIKLLDKNTTVRIKAITAVSIYRDIPYLGSFRSSDEVINKIYDTSAYTCHLNMQNYIWDGIKRDRLVWVGDMHPEMLTVRTVFGPHSIISDSLRFMRESTPLPKWMNGMPTYSLWWLYILYDWYLYTGDKVFLEENKEYATNLIEIIIGLVNNDGSDNLPSYFLDWPCNNKPQGISGSRALLALTLQAAAKLSKIYNNSEIFNKCIEARNNLMCSVPESYGAKQVTAMLSLSGWIDEKSAGQLVLENGAHGWSTFMSYYLLKASSKFSMPETLDALKDYYGSMLEMGATTFWEDFDLDWMKNASPIDKIVEKGKSDIHGDNGAFCYKGLRHSLCHGWSSAPTAFLAEEVMGIHILEPGCKKIELKPNLGYLKFIEGTYPTPFGNIYVKAENNNGKTVIKYTAPEEIEIII